MVLNDHEREWIDTYGFTVSTNSWGEYVLIDPQLPKGQNVFKGQELSELMLAAIKLRRKDGNGPQQQPPRMLIKPKKVETIVKKVTKTLKHGKLYHIKKMLIEDETLTPAQVFDNLKELGMPTTLTVVSQVRTELLESLRVLRELDALNC